MALLMEHTYVYIEPSNGAFVSGVCACGQLLTGYGTASLATMLSEHIKGLHADARKRRNELVQTLLEERRLKGYSK